MAVRREASWADAAGEVARFALERRQRCARVLHACTSLVLLLSHFSLRELAGVNPLRWSKKLSPQAMVEDLKKQTAERPVVLHRFRQRAKFRFTSAAGGRGGESVSEISNQTPSSATLGFIGAGTLLAHAACTYFLRRHAGLCGLPGHPKRRHSLR
jgi:hypothetical protein